MTRLQFTLHHAQINTLSKNQDFSNIEPFQFKTSIDL